MDDFFPFLLAQEKKNIEKLFPAMAPIVKPGAVDDSLHRIIRTLVGLKPSQVSRFGKERSEAEISSIAGYVCTNTLRVKCNNIFALLNEYAAPNDWGILFGDWQSYPDNKDVAGFLWNGADKNSNFQTYLSQKEIDKEALSWIKQENKVHIICNSCQSADSLEEYSKKLNKVGLIDDTLLMSMCRAKFFLCCSAKAYRSAGENEINDAFIKLSTEEKMDLAVNFVRVFELMELKGFTKMFRAIETEEKRYKNLFAERMQSAGLTEKYNHWRKMVDIIEIFKDNEDPYRTAFWLQYEASAKNTELVRFSNRKDKMLVMTFEEYVITEFGGKAEGRAYIFPIDLFGKYRRRINWQTMANFKTEVNDDMRISEKMAHLPGNGGWQSDFRIKLAKYGIKPNKA